jgi:hypothetical protein
MNFKTASIFAVVFAGIALFSHAVALFLLGYSTQYLTNTF